MEFFYGVWGISCIFFVFQMVDFFLLDFEVFMIVKVFFQYTVHFIQMCTNYNSRLLFVFQRHFLICITFYFHSLTGCMESLGKDLSFRLVFRSSLSLSKIQWPNKIQITEVDSRVPIEMAPLSFLKQYFEQLVILCQL